MENTAITVLVVKQVFSKIIWFKMYHRFTKIEKRLKNIAKMSTEILMWISLILIKDLHKLKKGDSK